MQLEGQCPRHDSRPSPPNCASLGRLADWSSPNPESSATHHTSGRIDADRAQVRRAICWNDHSLAAYHAVGLARLGSQDAVRKLIGGPWAIRYSLSHLVKDEETLSEEDWKRTYRILAHGSLAAGYLTGDFESVSYSAAAASTGLMDLRTAQWSPADARRWLGKPEHRELAWQQLPRIREQGEPNPARYRRPWPWKQPSSVHP